MSTKPLEDWTFQDIVDDAKGRILIAIGEGKYQSAVWNAINLAVSWRRAQDEKAKVAKKKKRKK